MLTSLLFGVALLDSKVSIPETSLIEHVRFLSSPELEGRLTTSKGMDLAVDYIEKHFKSAGLKPGPTGKFVHTYPITVNLRPTKNNSVHFEKGNKKWDLKLGTDFLPLAGSANAKPVEGELVYVGYGLETDDWKDYEGVDVKGKIALILRGSPAGKDVVNNNRKARLASEKGAIGAIFIGPATERGAQFPRTSRNQGVPSTVEIVAAGIHSKFFKDLVGTDFTAARLATAPASKALGVTVKMTTELEPNAGTGKNVIGFLPGNDPALKDEYIIVGGHFDHLGYGEVGSRTGNDVYHGGADDNASGSSGVIALAEYFGKTKGNKRTIIFQAYSGEEEGLVGSNAWAKDNPDILAKTTAMLNMDMIGTVRQNNVYVFGTSTSKGWDAVLNQVKVADLNLVTAPHVRGDSDQASFARRNVPVLFFHTGLTNDYHTENDLLAVINTKGMAKVASAVAETVIALDNSPKLEFDAQGVVLGNKPTDRVVPANDPPPSTTAPGGTRRIRVGFMPDYAAGGPGLLITGTVPDSPASKAGFKAGDRITEFAGKPVADIEGLAEAMKGLNPGDKVKVKFLRDGKEMTVELVVEERIDG